MHSTSRNSLATTKTSPVTLALLASGKTLIAKFPPEGDCSFVNMLMLCALM